MIQEGKGLGRFEDSLTQTQQYAKYKPVKSLKELNELIQETNEYLDDQKGEYFKEYKYKLESHEENLYKDSILQNRQFQQSELELRENPYEQLKEQYANHPRFKSPKSIKQMKKDVKWPEYPRRQLKNLGRVDGFSWLHQTDSKEYERVQAQEKAFSVINFLEFSKTKKAISDEFKVREFIEHPTPQPKGEYYYYGRNNNQFDFMKVCRIHKDFYNLSSRQIMLGQIPLAQQVMSTDETDPQHLEEVPFSLDDIGELYQRYSLKNEGLRKYVEKLRDVIESGDFNPLVGVTGNKDFCLIVLSLEKPEETKLRDVMIKDMRSKKLLPVLIQATSGELAMDREEGFFYIGCDSVTGRPARAMRHQIGTLGDNDVLLYEEIDSSFSIHTQTSKSEDFVYLEIRKQDQSKEVIANQIWVLPLLSGNITKKAEFQLVREMEHGITYKIDHSGRYFYVLLKEVFNEVNNKLIRVPVPAHPTQLLQTHKNTQKEASQVKPEKLISDQALLAVQRIKSLNISKSGERALALVSDDQSAVIARSSESERIGDFDLFQHYLAIHQYRENKSEIKVINLLKNTTYFIPIPAQEEDTSNQRLEFNGTFNSSLLKYKLDSPKQPQRSYVYNMGTRLNYLVQQDEVVQTGFGQYQTQKILIPDRTGNTLLPVLITYHKDTFTDKSPIILMTEGYDTTRDMIYKFDPLSIPLLDRGFILAWPMCRGTQTLSDEWLQEGVQDLKLLHFLDFIDIGIVSEEQRQFLKEKQITNRLCVLSRGYSGGLTALYTLVHQPFLFDTACVHNPVSDLLHYVSRTKDNLRVEKEFGNVKEQFALIQRMSPYESKLKYKIETDLLFTSDESDKVGGVHSFKFLAKLRRIHATDRVFNKIYYQQFDKGSTEENRKLLWWSFMTHSCLRDGIY